MSLSTSNLVSLFQNQLFSCFHVSGNFETSALNDPKMTLNTTRSKICLIYALPVFRVLNFSLLHSTGNRFEITVSLRKSALSNPKGPATQKGQRYLIYVILVPLVQKFQSFSLYDQPFSCCKSFP